MAMVVASEEENTNFTTKKLLAFYGVFGVIFLLLLAFTV
jgi:hypothetical protein